MFNINPLKFLLAYNLNWVHKLSANTAFGIGAELGSGLADPGNVSTAWGVLGEFRFYPKKKSLHGFYIAPNFSYTQTTNVYYYNYEPVSTPFSNSGYYTAQMLSLGLLIGWQWFPADNFSMGFALGFDDYIPLNQQTGDNYEDVNILGGLTGKAHLQRSASTWDMHGKTHWPQEFFFCYDVELMLLFSLPFLQLPSVLSVCHDALKVHEPTIHANKRFPF